MIMITASVFDKTKDWLNITLSLLPFCIGYNDHDDYCPSPRLSSVRAINHRSRPNVTYLGLQSLTRIHHDTCITLT